MTLDIAVDEILTPLDSSRIVRSEIADRVTAAKLVPIDDVFGRSEFGEVERIEFEVTDSASEGFGALLHKFGRSRAEDEKLGGSLAATTALIDETAKHRE